MPHTLPTTELNPWGGSPDPRRAPSPGLSKFQRDPDGRPGGRLRTRASAPQKYMALVPWTAPDVPRPALTREPSEFEKASTKPTRGSAAGGGARPTFSPPRPVPAAANTRPTNTTQIHNPW